MYNKHDYPQMLYVQVFIKMAEQSRGHSKLYLPPYEQEL